LAVWYPVMLKMEGKRCLVCGGGSVAERKIGGLLDAGARVSVVSPELSAGLRRLFEQGRLDWRQREARPEDVAGADYIFAATGDAETNRLIAATAQSAGVPINLADDGEAGDFLLPAVVRRGKFVLTASTSGAGPALAARVARELADKYGPEYEVYTDKLRQLREMVKSQVPDAADRLAMLSAAAEPSFLEDELTSYETGDLQRWIDQFRRRTRSLPDREEPL